MNKPVAMLIGLSFSLMVQSATASDRHHRQTPWADWYARTTIAQIQDMRRLGCDYHGDRWRGDYSRHHRWASRNSLARVEHEIRERDQRLRQCFNSRRYSLPHHRTGHSYTYRYPHGYYRPDYYPSHRHPDWLGRLAWKLLH